jgi:hypothetical protein
MAKARPRRQDRPTGTLAVLAQRLGTAWASPSTWDRLVRTYGGRRPRLRGHPAQPTVGLRTTRADERWHIDTTVIDLLDGTRAYLHAVINRDVCPRRHSRGPVLEESSSQALSEAGARVRNELWRR